MAFGVLAGQITVIFLEVLLGYVGARSGIIKDRDSKFLSDFIMKLLLPCTMLAGAAVDGEPELLTQAGVLFVLLLALFVATTGLCRLSSWLHHDTPGKYAVLVGTAAMPNCGFIGLPLCSALLGTARGTVFAGMAMASYNVWFFTYVVCLFRPGEKIRLKTFITPTNIATVAMLVLLATGWRLPAPVQQFCSAVGGCTTPLALMIVGVLLADSDIRALLHTGFLYRVTLLRGVVFPLLFMRCCGCCRWTMCCAPACPSLHAARPAALPLCWPSRPAPKRPLPVRRWPTPPCVCWSQCLPCCC